MATLERGGAERYGLGHPALTALSKREVGELKEFAMRRSTAGARRASICCLCLLHPGRVKLELSLQLLGLKAQYLMSN